MQKNVLIALAIVGTLTAGFFLFRNRPTKTVDVETIALKDIYNQWKVNYNINVGAAEDDFRFKVFGANYAKITQHNKLPGKTYKLGLNAFAHLTTEEFAATHLGLKLQKSSRNTTTLSLNNLPNNVDWTPKLNAIKDQGQCGSCWAFSAVGAIEGAYSVLKGQLFNLAEQELVDCSGKFGNFGCNGGAVNWAFNYARSVGGLATEVAYPYTAVDGHCQTVKERFGTISGYTNVAKNDPIALMTAVAIQPVSVAIEADSESFQLYESGVINDDSCGTALNHGVVVVGYNTEGSIHYYIVRNSWGLSWGEKGYVKIGIHDGEGICGIQMAASFPTL